MELFITEEVPSIRIMKAESLSGQWDPILIGRFIEMMEKTPTLLTQGHESTVSSKKH